MVSAEPILMARGLRLRFGRRRVLDGIDLDLFPGQVLGIAGENGCGKTTLIRVLAGMLLPSGGIVRRPEATGYAPQVPLLFDHLSPREHFRYFAAAHDIPGHLRRDRAKSLLQKLRFEAWESERVSTLSEGTRQKLNLALALLSDPAVLLLDEPYAGFEWDTYLRFWDYLQEIRATGKAVILVSHLFYERSKFDRLFELEAGTLREAS